MLFDIRGRRKHVVRVVYAILALLMGASLFLVVGPFNIANLIGGNTSGTSAAKVLQEQAEHTEAKLRREPGNEALQLSLVRARLGAGNALKEVSSETGQSFFPPEGKQEIKRGAEAWNAYLKQTKEPEPSVAALVSTSYFKLANSPGNSLDEVVEYLNGAARAQRIAAEAQPTINSLTILAAYEYFAGNFAAGDKAVKEAEAKTSSKAEAKEISKQMAEYRKSAKSFAAQKKSILEQEKSAGKERLENPLGGLGGSSESLGSGG